MTPADITLEKARLNLETSTIPWRELQRYFASGVTIAVNTELDLLEVAHAMTADHKTEVETWLKTLKIAPVTDQQALEWFENQQTVWALVVKPWILVQPVTNHPFP